MMINNLVHELPRVQKVLQMVSSLNGKVERVVDLGCGNGEITVIFKQKLGAKEVYGVDIDEKAILLAERRGIKVYRVNLNENKLPFSDEFFDLAVSLEVIEHLINPDNMLRESYRVLKGGGYLLISTPNLASWINRAILLLGYQPYNVEVSTEIIPGVPYRGVTTDKPAGHIRAFTLKALKEFLKHNGFRIAEIAGAPGVYPKNRFFRQLDRLFSLRASLARRLIILAVKEST